MPQTLCTKTSLERYLQARALLGTGFNNHFQLRMQELVLYIGENLIYKLKKMVEAVHGGKSHC